MSFSLPQNTIAFLPKSLGLRPSSTPSFGYEGPVCSQKARRSQARHSQARHFQEQRSNLQLTLAVLTALGIVLFPAVLGLS